MEELPDEEPPGSDSLGVGVYAKIWSVVARLETRGEGNGGGLGYA